MRALLERQRRHLECFATGHDAREQESFKALAEDIVRHLRDRERWSTDGLSAWYQKMYDTAMRAFTVKNSTIRSNIIRIQVLPDLDGIIAQVTATHVLAADGMVVKRERINTLLNWTSIVAGIIIIISVCVALASILGMYRAFTGPLMLFARATSSISVGEYREISYPHRDEFREVFLAFNGMVRSLCQLQAQVIQMDRLSSVGQLTRGIAHELNNPLVGVLGQAQLLLERLPADSPLRENVFRIERAAYRCKESVAKLLQFSRQHVYEYTAEDINQVLLDTLVMADSELKAHNVQVRHDLAKDLPRVRISAPHIQQAFLNRINNAIQAMGSLDADNRLTVRTYLTEIPPRAGGPRCYVTVEFRDTGCGIPAEQLATIFDPMFTTKDKTRHAGVGLSIASDIIAHHQGKLLVTSGGPGRGATFIVHLPSEASV